MTARVPTPARLARALGGFLPPAGCRVGLLGGSFNPAHGGHRHIALEALRRLDLDEIWWLVSPQNPLKPAEGMGDLQERLERARRVANHPRIRVTALERTLGTRYTADTLDALTRRLPNVRFVWLMGADNLAQVDRWNRWTRIFHTVPVAVFDRPSYSFTAVSAKAARRFARHRLAESSARRLADERPPAWTFLHVRRDPRSATAIRARQGR
jgi:nicotinate-nucleotide adenylyltransferase